MPLIGSTEDHLGDDANSLAPVTVERLGETLKVLEINYGDDGEGTLIAGFEGNPCWFRVAGPGGQDIAFVFDARWRHSLPADSMPDALMAINDWNQQNPFPRAMIANDEDGNVIFGCDFIRDFEFGLTDMQLRNDITIAITTTIQYWQMLDDRFEGQTISDDEEPEA